MARVGIGERRAAHNEVADHRQELRAAVTEAGLERPRLAVDGTVIVHSAQPGYSAVIRFATAAAAVVGTYVHVITDDVPAAETDAPPL